MNNEYETLRWPTNLDREAIVARLGEIRESALGAGLDGLSQFLDGIEEVPSARVGSSVIAALTWIEGRPEYIAFGTQLSMIAMNLKNLK